MNILHTLIILFIILLCLVTIIYFNNKKVIEGYEDRFTGTSIDACANFCKTTAGCTSFAYDKTNDICYPSQVVISGNPIQSNHKDSYSKDHLHCNKVDTVKVPTKDLPFDERKSNAMFVCYEDEGKHPQLYFHNQGKLNRLDEGQNFDYLPEVDNYEVKPYRWPQSKYNKDQLELLYEDRLKQYYLPSTVTDMDRVRQISQEQVITRDVLDKEFTEMNKTDQINIQKEETVIEKMPKFVADIIQDNMQLPNKVPTQTINDTTKVDHVFRIYDNHNHGQYLKEHKCTSGVKHQNCLKYCLENKDCVGVEWNPLFKNKKELCCPYRTIDKLGRREKEYINGKFYLKAPINDLEKQRIRKSIQLYY